MPHAIKMVEEFGKSGFIALLIESQGLAEEEIPAFMTKRFPKNRGWLTNERPFETDPASPGLPHAALVGVDGTMLWSGNPNGAPKKLEEMVAAEIKKATDGWGKAPEIKKARAMLYGKNQIAAAFNALAAVQSVKDDAKEDLDAAKAEVERRYASKSKAIKNLLAAGRFAAAQRAVTELEKAVKGKAEWEQEVAGFAADLKSADNEKELNLDKQFEKMVAALGEKSPNPEQAGPFKAFAKKNAGSKVAGRAEEMARWIEYKPK